MPQTTKMLLRILLPKIRDHMTTQNVMDSEVPFDSKSIMQIRSILRSREVKRLPVLAFFESLQYCF